MHQHSRDSWGRVLCLMVAGLVVAGCASTSRTVRLGNEAVLSGDWDAAVEHFRQAVQEDPDDAAARIALERAMQRAAQAHTASAQELEAAGELGAALGEYRQASGYDPTNGRLMAVVTALEQRLRDLAETSRPPSNLDRLRLQARQASQPPLLDPSSEDLLSLQFNQAQLRDILDSVGDLTGINVTYDQEFQDRSYSVQLDEVTVEEALDQILTATRNFYKVLNPRSLIVVPDTPQKRAQYEEQVIRTFFVSHADVTELATMLVQIVRAPTLAVQPQIVANPSSNTITVRATTAVGEVIEQVIAANDKPRAEVVVDVEILEVNRERAREFGLDLSSYSIGAMFSPTSSPSADTGDQSAGGTSFNANTLSGGVGPSDFYLAVPAAIIDFLETDSETKLVASPQLRGQEGAELTLNLGDDIPVPSTSFTAIATGGVAVNPLTSFEYRSVGVNLIMTPRVTYENEIILDLEVENSTLGPNINVAGQPLPTFGTRRVITRLRLRDGESNLLAGLLREEDRRSLRGFPGILHLPVVRQLLSANEDSIKQTDIVMLLTPRVVRTHELTQDDVSPIFIGTQNDMGVTGPPPLIAPLLPVPDGSGVNGDGAVDERAASPDLSAPASVEAGALPGRDESAPATAELPREVPPEAGRRPTFVSGSGQPALGALVDVTLPADALVVGRGPYTIPIFIRGASQLATLSLSLRYDPRVLRVSTIREGSFMRQGRASVMFAQQVDPAAGRVDLALTRTGDVIGAAGSGLVAAVVFEAVAPGSATLSPSGLGLSPAGAPLALSFVPTAVDIR